MIALDALQKRVSVGKLVPPAPTETQLKALFLSAQRAADHGRLRPWRFLTIDKEGLHALGELFCMAALRSMPDLSEVAQNKYRAMPLRAPMIVVVVAKPQEHPKVPELEQVISAGAAAQNIITAAFAQGLGAMWRTGEMASHPHVMSSLGLQSHEKVIGYIYLGTPAALPALAAGKAVNQFVQSWP